MRTAVAAGATGLLAATGAAVGFQQMAPADQPANTASTTTEPAVAEPVAAKKQKPRVKVRFERCPRGFVLQGRACVRDVERTVVVDVPGQPATPAPPAQPQPVSQPVQQPADDDEYGDDDYEGSQGDDDGYESDHGDDDGDEGEYGDDGEDQDESDEDGDDEDDDDEDGEDHDEEDHEDEPEDD